MKRLLVKRLCFLIWLASTALPATAAELPTLAGPAMGTTYRVRLARDLPGMTRGQVHREIELVLGRLDRQLSTWREDSDASRFNRARAGEWVDAGPDLIAIMAIARRVHDDTGGAFDVTVAAAEQGASVGMRQLETRESPPALRKARDRVALDLGGIGPGYAVDCLGGRLAELGSVGHLVELGGEVRAWGSHPSGTAWMVSLGGGGEVVELPAGEALATSTARPGRSPVDPRTGRVVEVAASSVTVRGRSCAEADARAVAELVLSAVASGRPSATGMKAGIR